MKSTRVRRLLALPLFLALTANLIILSPSVLAQPVRLAEATSVEPVAVIELTPKGDASANEASAITDRVRGLVVQSGLYQVMEREAMAKVMREQGFQTTQDCSGEACVQIGRLLSVKRMITGSLMRMGKSYTVNLRLIDTESGAILREEFLDCACALDSLTRDKLPWLVAQLLGTSSVQRPNPKQPQAEPEQDGRPIRVVRPWLLYAATGNINTGILEAQFNFNEYFAVHGGGGYGMAQSYASSIYGYSSGLYGTFVGLGGIKVYSNPHDLAGFADLSYGTSNIINGLLGAEYRHPQGLTGSLFAGMGFDVRAVQPHFQFGANVGFAF